MVKLRKILTSPMVLKSLLLIQLQKNENILQIHASVVHTREYYVEFLKKCFLCFSIAITTFKASAQQGERKQEMDIKTNLLDIRKSGYENIRKQQYDQAIIRFKEGLNISRKASLDSFISANYSLLGSAYRYKGQNDSALYYLALANEIAVQKKFISLQAFIQIESFAIYNRIGKGDSVAVVIDRLKSLLPGLDTVCSERAKIELYLGHNDKHKTKYREALVHYHKALHLFISLKDSVNEGIIYMSLANVMELLGEQDHALQYHQLAANQFMLLGRKYELLLEYLNITDLYTTSSQLDSAERYIRKALPIAEFLNDKSYLGNVYVQLGYIYKRRKQFSDAKGYFLQAVHFSEMTKNDINLMNAYQGLGEIFMAEQEPLMAEPFLEKHLLLAKQQNDREEMMEAFLNLAENENALHHYEKAFEYQKLLTVYKDSAYTETTAKSMAEMESKYQAEKKEKEIDILKKDQQLNRLTLQKQKNFQLGAVIFIFLLMLIAFLFINRYRLLQRSKRLIEMERMRNTIARDLHDDIGSTLTSINILSNVALQQESAGENLMGSSMQKIKERSSAIMENMSDIVWAINPSHDTMEQLIFRMKEFSAGLLEPLNINYTFKEESDFSAIKLDINKRKDFYLLYKEAINNAAKYSHCKNLSIILKQDQLYLHLTINDNGIGFHQQEVKRGNGLANMKGRAAAMKAEISIDSAVDEGTNIKVKVPIT